PIQIGMRKTESRISISAIPSIPRAQLNPAKSGTRSTNCHWAPPISYWLHSRTPRARSIRVATRAMVRAAVLPTTSEATAPTSGTSSISERMGKPVIVLVHHHPADPHHQTDEHDQRIAIEISRLDPLRDARALRHHPGGAVGAEPVDDADIALLPQHPAEPEGRADEEEVVELVEVPLVEDELVHDAELLDEGFRQLRIAQVGIPGGHEADGHHGERRPLHPYRHAVHVVDQVFIEDQRALPELARALADEVMGEEEAGEDRAQAQQDQRHQHRERALVRMIAAGAFPAVRIGHVVLGVRIVMLRVGMLVLTM